MVMCLLAAWLYGCVVIWLRGYIVCVGYVVVWVCSVVIGLHGYIMVWLYRCVVNGYVVAWLCGCMGM